MCPLETIDNVPEFSGCPVFESGAIVSNCVPTETLVFVDPVSPVYNSLLTNDCDDVCKGNVGCFQAPLSRGGRFINVFEKCTRGDCSCVHQVGGNITDLKPCRVAEFLFGGECLLPAELVTEIWDGLCDGFRIVDDVDIPSYSCENYESITKGKFYLEMSELIHREVA